MEDRTMKRGMYQIVRRGRSLWDVYLNKSLESCPDGSTVQTQEHVARVNLDPNADRYVVERPIWKADSITWHVVGGSYLTFAATVKSITHPKPRE